MKQNTDREKPKYILIISQFYHTRHTFVVDVLEDAEYYKMARLMIEELERHKRLGTYTEGKEIEYGDMDEEYFSGSTRRYNVNDAGDIYLIPCWSIGQVLATVKEYWDDSKRESVGYKKKDVTSAIERCHGFYQIKEIVEKYFTIL